MYTTSIAWKNLWAGKARFAFSVAGVAASVLLTAFMLALYRGWNDAASTYLYNTGADVWVARFGTESFFSPSVIQSGTAVQVQQFSGVESSTPMLVTRMRLHTDAAGYDMLLVGVPAPGSIEAPRNGPTLGGPHRLIRGREVATEGEIVVDNVLARQAGLEIGDKVGVGLRSLEVVGISGGGNVIIGQLCFVSMEELRIVSGFAGFYSFMLLESEGDASALAEEMNRQIPGITAFPSDEFAGLSLEVLDKSTTPILVVVLAMSFLVGAILVALTVYTAVLEKEREFGVLKALGTRPLALFAVVLQQSLICCVLGFLAGQVLVIIAAEVASGQVPQFVTQLRGADEAWIFVATLAMGTIAAIIPAARIVRIDALSVFKA